VGPGVLELRKGSFLQNDTSGRVIAGLFDNCITEDHSFSSGVHTNLEFDSSLASRYGCTEGPSDLQPEAIILSLSLEPGIQLSI